MQLLLGRDYFWLPQLLLKRSVEQQKLKKVLKWLGRPARFVDRLLRPRLIIFLQGPSVYLIAIICLFFAAALPFMELVPFSAHGAGIVLAAFGLSLIADDGFLALLAFGTTILVFGLMISQFFR